MLIEKIRAATAKSHEQLESRLFPYLETLDSPEKYARLLAAFHGYISPVQDQILQYIDRSIVPDIDSRRQASLLVEDLKELNHPINGENPAQIPAISTHAEAMGALYVLEGSTLGGKIIAKTVREKLGEGMPLRFFSGYGTETGAMWKKFIQYLAHPDHEQSQEQVCNGAAETFRLFGTWFEKSLAV